MLKYNLEIVDSVCHRLLNIPRIILVLNLLQDIEVWEDETISYACKNKSLVFNGVKGVYTVSYRCKDDGTYDTPKGKEEGDPWPECTLKPVDPCK